MTSPDNRQHPRHHDADERPDPSAFTVDVMIPVLNEAHVLEKSVLELRDFLAQHVAQRWRVVVVDNGSKDGTDDVARSLAGRYADVAFVHLDERGRGRALRQAWSASSADVVCYTDVDLSTELPALPKMIDAILFDGYDLATGSRLMRESRTRRSFKRELISRCYNVLVRAVLRTRFSDAQCGFKAASRAVIDNVMPHVEDQSWFFDTELLTLGEKWGYAIKDIPVQWIEDDDSRVKIVRTAWDDIKGVCRVRWYLWFSPIARDMAATAAHRPRPVRVPSLAAPAPGDPA